MEYTLRKNKRAKNLRLSVYQDGRVVLTVPPWVGSLTARRFFDSKKDWVSDRLIAFKTTEQSPVRPRRRSRKEYLKYKESARSLVHARLEHFSVLYGISYNRIFIKNQKSCWGSCSEYKNISINYRILFLTKEQQDYILVHELCHIQELNHSPAFWSLVAQTVPEYKRVRKELRRVG